MEQGTPEWFAARLGKVTASKIADVMAKTKTGYSASRANYRAQLVAERLTGTAAELSFTNAAMQHGTDTEPLARKAYEDATGAFVEQVGIVAHPTIADSAASPDGLVDDAGLVEIKCPNTATHIDTLLGSAPDRKYMLQMAWQMACTGRKWCDFVSFDNRLPPHMALHIIRIERDEVLIAEIEKEVKAFLLEVAETVEQLQEKFQIKEAA